MLKKTIAYVDFNGAAASEDFFFHLSQAELVELEMSHEGGMSTWIQSIVAAEDGKTIMAEMKNIILSAYGKKSADGRRFVKNQEIRDEFLSSEAYSVLFMELVTDAEAAAQFAQGLMPQNLIQEATRIVGADLAAVPDVPVTPEIELPADKIIVTRHDLQEMDPDNFDQTMAGVAAGTTQIVD